jgi:hypothetical protein
VIAVRGRNEVIYNLDGLKESIEDAFEELLSEESL